MTKKQILDYIFITLGTFILAYAVIIFWQPHGLVTGGISGLGIIIAYVTDNRISVALTNLVLNIPLFLIGLKVIRREYFVRSLYAYFILTGALSLVELLPTPEIDLLMSSIFGGVVAGIGVGMVLRTLATTGGTTLAATILHQRIFKQFSVAKILFVVDSFIILIGFFVFGIMATMYAIIAVFVATRVTDAILEGFSFAKAAYIISKKSDIIASTVMMDLNRGVTGISSKGMFTQESLNMLMCVVSAKELVTLKELVYSIDERAFVIVADVREVLGVGFTIDGEKLPKPNDES